MHYSTVKDYENISHCSEIHSTDKILCTYSNLDIRPIDTAELPIVHKGNIIKTLFEILNIDQENVISGTTAENLGLFACLSTIEPAANSQTTTGLDEFPELKHTNGTLPEEYSIKLKAGAKVVHPSRRRPPPLHGKVIEKLHEMEADGHIVKVENPTEWVSSMTVSVRNDKVPICIDPKDLNAASRREHYPMRTVQEMIADIPEAKIFSKPNANSGFLQIHFDEASSFLATFNTQIGKYR